MGSFKFPNVENRPQLKELNGKWAKFLNRKDENFGKLIKIQCFARIILNKNTQKLALEQL